MCKLLNSLLSLSGGEEFEPIRKSTTVSPSGGFAPSAPRVLCAGCRFEFITQRAVITAFESAAFTLAFARLDQMFQTARSLHGRFPAFGATLVAPHSQLIFALPRNPQARELVFNTLSHGCFKARRTSIPYQSSISMTESSMMSNLSLKSETLRADVCTVSFRFLQKGVKIGHWLNKR